MIFDSGRCGNLSKAASSRSAKATASPQPDLEGHGVVPKGNVSCHRARGKAPRTALMCKAARKIPRIVEALAKNRAATCNPRCTRPPRKKEAAVKVKSEVAVPRAAPSRKPIPGYGTNDSLRLCDKDDASADDARLSASPLATEVVLSSDSDGEIHLEEFVDFMDFGAGKGARWLWRQDVFVGCNVLDDAFGGRVLFKPHSVLSSDRNGTLLEGSLVAVKCRSVQDTLQQRHGPRMENILVRVSNMQEQDDCQDLWQGRHIYRVPVLRRRHFSQDVGSACICWTDDVPSLS